MKPKAGHVTVTSEVAESELGAFMEHLDAFKRRDTDAQRAAEIRAQDESDGLDSLKRLFDIAHSHSGQCRIVAAFLLGLYNGQRFPFDMTEFRSVDAAIFEDMLRVLRLDSRPKHEVHDYFPNGGQAFERLANDWRLHKQEWKIADSGRSFCIQVDGYLCFLAPAADAGQVKWRWFVQSGGSWAWRGGEEVVTHGEGFADRATSAEQAIRDWIEASYREHESGDEW